MLRRLASVVAVTAIVAGTALAQGDEMRPLEGTYYLGGGARWMSINSNNAYAVNANVGYLFRKNIAGEAGWGYLDNAGVWQSVISLKAKYIFGENTAFAPYLAAGGVFSKISGFDDTTYLLGGGFDYFLNPNASIYVDVATYKLDFDGDWTWDTSIGFRFWFK